MKKIGEGKTASIYTDNLYAYKKYHASYDMNNMTYEVYVQNQIYQHTSLNVLKYEIEDQMIKMIYLKGKTLADEIRTGEKTQWLEMFIKLQHSTYLEVPVELVSAFDVFETQIKHSTKHQVLIEKALQSLERIEKTQYLCHLDFHPENIMSHENEYYILDWTNAKLANPVMDIASTYIIFVLYLPDLATTYLHNMSEISGYSVEKIVVAIPVMAFIKLRENDIQDHEPILKKLIVEPK